MIVISSGEDFRNVDCPRTEAEAKRMCDRFKRCNIPYNVEFF